MSPASFLQKQERCGINMWHIWFQQDGMITHTARASMEVTKEMFPSHVISRRSDLPWPLSLSDVSVCDCFLWDNLKWNVFFDKPHMLDELKADIYQGIMVTSQDLVQPAMRNFQAELQEYVQKKKWKAFGLHCFQA